MSFMSGESETVSFQASETQNTIQRILQSCFKLVEAGDIHESDSTISELVNFLDSLSDAALSYPNNEPAQNDAFDALTEIHQYICSPSLAQEAVDAHSFELPKAVSKFSYQFLKKCGLRDMLSILCNTLGYSSNMTKAASYIVPPLSGLSKVFTSNKKCHFEQVQLVVPIILNVLKAVALDSYDSDDTELESVFHRAVGILNSIYEVCNKLGGVSNEKF
ncbi:aberrant root formation protein 4-like [Arachis ipaensis]|uniref:aberrant root formation protein 4-like n=1 Tax=Arachis ipaensis TaxID=130454 RepID=UPI000A2B0A2C|nr:aberrant root formation protein 4-like [Arachis ipaensis]